MVNRISNDQLAGFRYFDRAPSAGAPVGSAKKSEAGDDNLQPKKCET